MSRSRNALPILVLSTFLSFTSGSRGATVLTELPCRLRVEAGASARVETPMTVPLAEGVKAQEISLFELKDGKRLPVASQIIRGHALQLAWILTGTTPVGGERVFEVSLGGGGGTACVHVKSSDSALTVSAGGRALVQYNTRPVPAPEGVDSAAFPLVYGRTGYIHPLRTLSGKTLTAVYPADHIHHVGLWHPWTGTEFEGRHVDFWNLKKGEGTIRFAKLRSQADGPVFGEFSADQQHIDLKAPGGEKVVLDDILNVRVWTAARGASRYVMDYVTTQSPASESPLKVGPYRYGGFGFRSTMDWKANACTYLTSDGDTDKASNSALVRWCRLQGPTAGGRAGVLFMSHPGNHEHPESTRTWGGMGKDGGFFNFNPAQKNAWVMKPGETYTSRYRMCVYDGDLPAEDCERMWQDFGNPPTLTVIK